MPTSNDVLITVDPSLVIDAQMDSQAFFDNIATSESYQTVKSALDSKIKNASDIDMLGMYITGAKITIGTLTKSTFVSAPLTVADLTTSIADLAEAVDSGQIKASDITAITSAIVSAIGSVGAMAALAPAAVVAVAGTPVWLAGMGLAVMLGAAGILLDKYGSQLNSSMGEAYDALVGEVKAAGQYLDDLSQKAAQGFTNFIDGLSQKYYEALNTVSPLILDLDGDGVSSISRLSGVHFDHDANGFAESTGWVSKKDALLVWDRNHDGVISSGAELFGNQSLLPDQTKSANGFEALKQLDSNHDGVFDASDEKFSEVKLWKDANSNGLSEQNELVGLQAEGIVSINLTYLQSTDVDANGNQHLQAGTFVRSDGSISAVDDVWFATNPADSIGIQTVDVSDAVAAMPEIRGAGTVHNLQQAMQLDTTRTLYDLVKQFISDPDLSDPSAVLDRIIFTWTGTTQIDPASRGENIDARKLAAIEAFMGKGFTQGAGYLEGSPNPALYSAQILDQVYGQLKSYVSANLNLHNPIYQDVIAKIGLDFTGADVSYDMSKAVLALRALYEEHPGNGHEFITNFYTTLLDAGGDGAGMVAILRADGNPAGQGFSFDLATATEWVYGTASNDTINDAVGGRVFDGAGGSDLINSTGGNNVFMYNAGYGYLEINNALTPDGYAVLKLGHGINAASLVVTTTDSGNSLILSDGVEGDEIVLDYSLISNYGVKTVVFADGSTLSRDQLIVMKDAWLNVKKSTGTPGNDNLNGDAGAQPFDGKGGQDVINGGGGNDIFTYKAGYGYLEIINGFVEADNPILKFGPGITSQSLRVTTTSSGNSMILTDGIDGDMVVLDYNIIYSNYGVKLVSFDDGSSLSMQQLTALKDHWLAFGRFTGTVGRDTVYGTADAQTIDGKGGGDIVYGQGGNDTFIYAAGYKSLTIINQYVSTDSPKLQLGDGITEQSLKFLGDGKGGLVIATGVAGDEIVLDGMLSGVNQGIKTIKFSDGHSISATDAIGRIQLITSDAGSESLIGTPGYDRFAGATGHHVILGGEGEDTVVYTGAKAEYKLVLSKAGEVQVVSPTGNVDTIQDIERLQFSDGIFDASFSKVDPEWLKKIGLLYETVLDRPGDYGGLTTWTTVSMSLPAIADQFINAFNNAHGSTSNFDFIKILQTNALDRSPDSAFTQNWVEYMGSHTRAETVIGLIESPEVQEAQYSTGGLWFGGEDVGGTPGNDKFTGATGQKIITGGSGEDTIVYSGAKSEYKLMLSDAGLVQVVALNGNVDTIRDIEKFDFADGVFDVSFTKADPGLLKQIGLLYETVLDRPGDYGGLTTWTTVNMSLPSITEQFINAFNNAHGSTSDYDFVKILQTNALDHAPDPAFTQEWMAYLGSHSRAETVIGLIGSSEVQTAQFASGGLWFGGADPH
ncbi:DUF4214 domain-containing protein [Pseudomonas graminis]|uniref:DUF4214 domain-containing protein n=1 Tax=Pseudomonas graminis TaxID=158627 RepID=UPI003C22831C